jgi:hypothetical protein
MFAHLDYNGDISFLKKGLYDDRILRQTFYFHLLRYIVCHICPLITAYGKEFLIHMFSRFNEEAIDRRIETQPYEMELKACLDFLGIEFLSSSIIMAELQNPESAFNKNGCE